LKIFVLINFFSLLVCHHKLDEEEKRLIDNWITLNRSENETIDWNNLRQYLKNQLGFLRSENMLRKYWYSKQSRQIIKENQIFLLKIFSNLNITNIINYMIGNFRFFFLFCYLAKLNVVKFF
jgi:hypothetical protein